jgi:hypothetical protein
MPQSHGHAKEWARADLRGISPAFLLALVRVESHHISMRDFYGHHQI